MIWHRVRPKSYRWVKWIYLLWLISLLIILALYLIGQGELFARYLPYFVIAGIAIIVFRVLIHRIKKTTRLIHRHIVENELCEMEYIGRKVVYHFFPRVTWKVDKRNNTFRIRFVHSGRRNFNYRDLEAELQDRFQVQCLNTFEERKYMEYIFENKEEKQMIINSKEDIKGEVGETSISFSQSLVWDWKKHPHFIVVGTTGSGKTTFIKYMVSTLMKQGVDIYYFDVKRDDEMEKFCKGNASVHYAYEAQAISKKLDEIMIQLATRGKKSDDNKPIYVIADEIIALKLLLPKKDYEAILNKINAIVVSGRSKQIFCAMVSQSALAEYFGNSGFRNNFGLLVSLGQMSEEENGMIFGKRFSTVKNCMYDKIGSGLIKRKQSDSRPRGFLAPYVKDGVLN